MYLLPRIPLPSISGFVPRPSSTSKPIAPAAPATSAVAPPEPHDNGSSPGSSIQCAQQTPVNSSGSTPQSTSQGTPKPFHPSPQNHVPVQNVAPPQPSAPVPQYYQQLPVAQQQQQQQLSPLNQPQFPSPSNLPQQPNQPQITQPRITPQVSPVRQPRQQSPFRTQITSSAQPFIPAAVAPTGVHSTPEKRVPKTTNGEGVKSSRKQGTETTSSAPDGQLCFRCGKPGHLRKDCPEPPCCSKCKTKGHIPAKCPSKKQGNRDSSGALSVGA